VKCGRLRWAGRVARTGKGGMLKEFWRVNLFETIWKREEMEGMILRWTLKREIMRIEGG
jgi:hypothetical protein